MNLNPLQGFEEKYLDSQLAPLFVDKAAAGMLASAFYVRSKPLLQQPLSQAWRITARPFTPQRARIPSAAVNLQRQTRWLANDTLKAREGSGTTTPVPENADPPKSKPPFYFATGYALFAKRPSRPFPPPFLSLPSTSFSEPLSTHDKSRDRRPTVNGQMIRGVTNGDDAVLVSESFIAANDGVGAWAAREKGHAA